MKKIIYLSAVKHKILKTRIFLSFPSLIKFDSFLGKFTVYPVGSIVHNKLFSKKGHIQFNSFTEKD